jgi:hypothetical protein
MGKKIVFLMTVCSIFLVVVFFEFFIFRTQVYGQTAKIASVTKDDSVHSMLHYFAFTVQVLNNGTSPLNNATVVIRLYHDWMTICCLPSGGTKYTNEVLDYESYESGRNVLHFGMIPAGGNETQSTNFLVSDTYYNVTWGGGGLVPINYGIATLFLGESALDKQTLQFNFSQGWCCQEQTWVFP